MAKVYLAILGVFKKSSFECNYAAICKFEKMSIFENNQNMKWKYLPRKWSRIIVTSFTKDKTTLILFLAILGVFKKMVCAVTLRHMKIWETLAFFKKFKNWNRNIFQENEVDSL